MGIEQEIKLLSKEYSRDIHKVENEVSKDILKSVKDLTPVDTGKARNGWEIEESQNGALITNDVDYIEYLEYGTKHQRAYAMVRLTMQNIDKFIKKAIIRVNNNGK